MKGRATRRVCCLSLARREWAELVGGLAALPDVAQTCAAGVSVIQQALARSHAKPDELVLVAQSPLQWSALILGLSVHVLRRPGLLGSAERLRDQMMAQARRVEGLPTSTDMRDLGAWSPRPGGGMPMPVALN